MDDGRSVGIVGRWYEGPRICGRVYDGGTPGYGAVENGGDADHTLYSRLAGRYVLTPHNTFDVHYAHDGGVEFWRKNMLDGSQERIARWAGGRTVDVSFEVAARDRPGIAQGLCRRGAARGEH